MRLRGLPNLPVVHTDSVYRRTAQDLMDPAVSFLTLDSTFEDAANLVRVPPPATTMHYSRPNAITRPLFALGASWRATPRSCAAWASSTTTTPSGPSPSSRSSTTRKTGC